MGSELAKIHRLMEFLFETRRRFHPTQGCKFGFYVPEENSASVVTSIAASESASVFRFVEHKRQDNAQKRIFDMVLSRAQQLTSEHRHRPKRPSTTVSKITNIQIIVSSQARDIRGP